ncbi:cohesin domain-containing protein [Desulfococcaceae bacterium HSG9]|nr:cohesin domain-containing protein [Desulfococcaceae bacterium HSG9]
MNKTITYSKLYLFCALILIALPAITSAAVPRLIVQAPTNAAKPGEQFDLDLRISDIQPVYGAELTLHFDPEVLEIIDADTQTEDIQIKPGTFFDLNQNHFMLQNLADNIFGTVNYAVSMLNPSPAAQGEGTLMRIAFRVKKPGATEIQIKNCKFGTRDGQAIVPEYAIDNRIQADAQLAEMEKVADGYEFSLTTLYLGSAGVMVISVLVIAVARRRRVNKKKYYAASCA